jgi:preprotein translocase subunit SecE
MKINKIKNIPGKISSFFKEVQLELKKVNWPTRKEALRYTLIVIMVSAVVAAFLGGLDFIFTKLIEKFIIS